MANKINDKKFYDDLKSVRDVLVYASTSREFFKVTKGEVLKKAKTEKIEYYLTDKIFVVKRVAMVII